MTAAEVKLARASELVMERDASFGTVADVPVQGTQLEAKHDMRMVSVSLT